ncbi:MAG: hypothetical protein J7M25_15105 [Deltaproteobacteria bacterium]|nr:hypothetical protein [Deltaproteobacteria bacterium]
MTGTRVGTDHSDQLRGPVKEMEAVMKSGWKKTTMVAIVMATLAVPAVASAWPGRGMGRGRGMGGGGRGMGYGRGMGGGGMGMMGGMGRRARFMMNAPAAILQNVLGINAGQAAQIVKAREGFKTNASAIHLKMTRIDNWMQNQWFADRPDYNKIRALHRQMIGQRVKLAKLRLELRIKVLQILGPAKRKQLMLRGFGGPGWGYYHWFGPGAAPARNR